MVTTVISATFLGSRAAEMGKKTLCGFPATLPRISHTQHWRPLMLLVLVIIIREDMMEKEACVGNRGLVKYSSDRFGILRNPISSIQHLA